MGFSLTVVHAPGSLSTARWNAARDRATGAYEHELRLVADEHEDSLSGPRLDAAIREFLETPDIGLTTSGRELRTLTTGSGLLHPGMVVLVSPPEMKIGQLRPPQLQFCLDSGPDSGRLIPLRRGRTSIGRGQTTIRAADPTISRKEAVLDVGSRAITLHRHAQHDDAGTRLTTEAEFQLGSSSCRITAELPAPHTPQSWPTAAEPVRAAPPEGKHKMMLAFALVPLVAGLVLVAVTGMWFFLLFSGASALVASAVFWDGSRKHRRYRRHVSESARTWALRTYAALCSPGDLVRLLRSHHEERVCAGASGEEGPAVRLGTGHVAADLDFGSATADAADVPQVPAAVAVTLKAGEEMVITGSERDTHRLARWILVQLVLNPSKPRVALIGADPPPELRDLGLVSHTSAESFTSLLNSPTALADHPRVLIVADPREARCAHQALGASWHVVTLADGTPGARGWTVDLQNQQLRRRAEGGTSEIHAEQLIFDGLSKQTLSQHLRLALPHLGASTSGGDIPESCTYRLPQKLFTDTAAEELNAVLGRGSEGMLTLDLVGDGPHILIAGTTGSGKSELLKTLLMSLCARYAPSELGLVLIDFKGGAAFQRISQLEHSLGLVTDLSQAAAERTLEGIRSELVRRERLFLQAGAGDYGEYRQLHPDEALSRILVVIDEFRIFSHELPDQLDELMRLATLGRSLGLHLVLSTQRPQGAVTADIRANIGASICLRVRGDDESRDVIGDALAAAIPRTVPGRAALRRPGEQPMLFQTAQLASHQALQLRPEVVASHGPPRANFGHVATTVQSTAAAQGQSRAHTPLLPALPVTLLAHDRLELDATDLPLLGRLDDPAGQRQEDLVMNPREPSSLALVGEVGSGAAEAAAAVTSQILDSETEADLYLLDGDRSLAPFAQHARVGSWLTEDDAAEVDYLLSALADELAVRRIRGSRASAVDVKPLVVVVTGYSQWHASSHTALPMMDHIVGTLAAEGPQVGISVVITGGRELAVGKLLSRFSTRIYLPLGTSEDTRYLWPKVRSVDPLPGRGVLLTPHIPPPGLTVQLVTEAPSSLTARGQHKRPAVVVRPLPERLLSSELPASPEQRPSRGTHPIIGVEQLTWEAVEFPLGPVNLILGPAGSGKSTCLQLLKQHITGSCLLTPGAQQPVQAPSALLVDDAHACTPKQHSDIQHALSAGVPIVAAAAASSALFTQLPWAHRARTEGSNMILSPTSRSQADAFATIIPLLARPIPGRAVHLRSEGPVMMQWALPR